jgi:hypothetical protein
MPMPFVCLFIYLSFFVLFEIFFLSTMLKGVIVVNNYGKPRMIKFYEHYVKILKFIVNLEI